MDIGAGRNEDDEYRRQAYSGFSEMNALNRNKVKVCPNITVEFDNKQVTSVTDGAVKLN